MEIEQLTKNLKISKNRIKYNESMKNYTTFKIGGLAECLIKIEKKEELEEVLKLAIQNNIPVTIIGNGSNILVSDKGIKGITLIMKIEKINIQQNYEQVENRAINEEDENGIIYMTVGAGEKLSKLSRICLKEEITGIEELAGIPGTIGGAIRMNAGAYGKEMKDIVNFVTCIDYNGNEKKFTKDELEFGYRTSIFQKEKYIIVEAQLELHKGKFDKIKEKLDEYMVYRKEKQPTEYPSAGSAFKRDTEFITAKLIEEAGLKGFRIGDAMISTKHSGFIINNGNATAEDVMTLIDYVKKEIYEKFNKKIEVEIEMIGD